MNNFESFPSILIKNSKLNTLDFDNLNFGKTFSDHMFIADFENGEWTNAELRPFENIEFSPASCVFHYGQAIFEGMKAYKTESNEIALFRPEENWKRMNSSATRMSMPTIPKELFINGIKELVKLDSEWIPEKEDQSLYIRPFMIANDEFLGVKASESYKFIVFTSPTSNYYKGAVSVKVENHYARAASGGIGAAKAAANYAASLLPAKKANDEGYDQLIWTDSKTNEYIEESGTMNLMLMVNGTLLTPSLEGNTILPGITRASVIHLAREWGIPVEERKISVKEINEAAQNKSLSEAFGVGTAATVAPIKRIRINDVDYDLPNFETWEFSNKVATYLKDLKKGRVKDKFNWLTIVE